jgi:UDP-glucose 4-epimerase
MSVLVIGNGLVGGGVVDAARAAGLKVAVASNIPWDFTALAVDALDDVVRHHVDQWEHWTIVWAAGRSYPGRPPQELHQETTYLDRVLVAAARSRFSPGKIVFVSSGGGVYGGWKGGPITDYTPLMPASDYGRAKVVQERMVGTWARQMLGRAVIVRPSNVYGPRQDTTKQQGLISWALRQARDGFPITITAPLDSTRDYVHAADAGEQIVRLALADHVGHVTERIIASGVATSIAEVLSLAIKITGRDLKVDHRVAAEHHPHRIDFAHTSTSQWYRSLEVGMTQMWERMR